MKKLLLTIVLSLAGFAVYAQNIPLPDGIGKYLFGLMAERQDLSGSMVYTDIDNFSKLFKENRLPALNKQLEDASDIEKGIIQSEIDNLDNQARYIYDTEIKNSWALLLQNADKFKINSQSATYNRTFFSQFRIVDFPSLQNEVELSVAINFDNKIYIFEIVMLWVNNKWLILEVDPNLYEFMKTDYGDYTLQNETKIESTPEDPIKYNFNEAGQLTTLEATRTIEAPDAFSRKILNLITSGSSYSGDKIFMTESEYMKEQGNAIISELKAEAQNNPELLNEISEYLENPSLLFDIDHSWKELQESLKEEFGGVDISNLSPNQNIIEITNWNRKFKNLNNITARVDMSFEYNHHQCGIIFYGIWHENMWKLSDIQPFPYLIEPVTDADVMQMEDAAAEAEVISADED